MQTNQALSTFWFFTILYQLQLFFVYISLSTLKRNQFQKYFFTEIFHNLKSAKKLAQTTYALNTYTLKQIICLYFNLPSKNVYRKN